MTSSARRDPLRELAFLARAPEPGSTNLGEYLANNAGELAQVLGTPAKKLEAMRSLDDEHLTPFVRGFVQRARSHQVQEDLERRRQRSLEAASRLGATARRTELGYELDVDILLGELLADRSKKWVRFVAPDQSFVTTIPMHLLSAARPLRHVHIDLAGWVDDGLHLRWRGGKGGINAFSRDVHTSFEDRILAVPLAAKIVHVPERRRGGAWLGHILEQMGFV
jgi:hypothetical protein